MSPLMARSAATSLTLKRPWRRVEEFTLFEDKVRVETKRPFGNSIVEIPLRFLDSTWAIQKGSSNVRYLVFAAAVTAATGVLWMHAAASARREWVGPVGVMSLVWAFGAPMGVLAWRKGRYDVIAFTTLHPNYGNLVIPRDAERELEVMQFADAVGERIKLLQLTKPDG